MFVSVKKAQEIKSILNIHPNYYAVCPSVEMATELTIVHDIPAARIKVLASVMVAGHGDIVILSKRQLNYYQKQEDEILKKAGVGASEN